MKIRIIGGSGSGKSFLANKLSSLLEIPHFDLDDIQWDNTSKEYGVKTPIEIRNSLLENILENENWIIEGVYYKWCEKTFEDADKIYLLIVPKRIYVFRIIKRFMKRKLGFEKGKKETLKSLTDLIKWTKDYEETELFKIQSILSKYSNKVYLIKNAKEAKKLLSNYKNLGDNSKV